MYQINPDSKSISPLTVKSFSELDFTERYDLQEWISHEPESMGEELLIIQKEFDGSDDPHERLDFLALDKQGNLVIIENKLETGAKQQTRIIDDLSEGADAFSCFLDLEDNSGTPVDNSGTSVDSSGTSELTAIARKVSEKTRAPRKEMEQVILDLCSIQPLSLEQLTELLSRSEALLRKNYLTPLVQQSKKLRYKYPTKPHHPAQAYITNGSEADKKQSELK